MLFSLSHKREPDAFENASDTRKMDTHVPWWRRAYLRIRKAVQPLISFVMKSNNDWIFNLSAMLAYSLLMSIFPILLVLLAAVGFFLGDQAPDALAQIKSLIEQVIPGGGEVFQAVTIQLARNAGLLLVIGVVTAAFAGSRLFIALENCFNIIFRVRGRDFIHQNLMAFGMLLLYIVLVALIAVASTIPSLVIPIIDQLVGNTSIDWLIIGLSTVVAGVSALVLFGAIYVVVPNKLIRLREIWPGTILATLLFLLYETLFPFYIRMFFRPDRYGTVAAFAVVALLFFYYLAFILLLGAELNSWIGGQREMPEDLPTTLYRMRPQPVDERTDGARE